MEGRRIGKVGHVLNVLGNERKRIWAGNRIKEGKCPSCKNGKVIPDAPYCSKCKDKLLRRNKGNRHKYPRKYTAGDLLKVQQKRKEWKEQGLCQGCGKVEVENYYCDECKEKMRIRQERWRGKNEYK